MSSLLEIPIASARRMVAGGKRYGMSQTVKRYVAGFRICCWIPKHGTPVMTFGKDGKIIGRI